VLTELPHSTGMHCWNRKLCRCPGARLQSSDAGSARGCRCAVDQRGANQECSPSSLGQQGSAAGTGSCVVAQVHVYGGQMLAVQEVVGVQWTNEGPIRRAH
jgi:hypothetical protein